MIELSDLIQNLRDELEAAISKADSETLRFELGTIELEVQVALEKSVTPGAKVKFYVVEIGGEGKIGSTATQRVKLSLTPRMGDGNEKTYVDGSNLGNER